MQTWEIQLYTLRYAYPYSYQKYRFHLDYFIGSLHPFLLTISLPSLVTNIFLSVWKVLCCVLSAICFIFFLIRVKLVNVYTFLLLSIMTSSSTFIIENHKVWGTGQWHTQLSIQVAMLKDLDLSPCSSSIGGVLQGEAGLQVCLSSFYPVPLSFSHPI